jgi:Calcineurin-like phosphoesterase
MRRHRTRDLVIDTPRSASGSLWLSSRERARRRFPTASVRDQVAFLTHSAISWGLNFILHATEGRIPFPTYPEGQSGIVQIPDVVTVALAADWGTGTDSAYAVGAGIAKATPDITIHLGDVYYCGDHEEFANYFLPLDCWPRGRIGTYTLVGNHEMYSGGRAYFDFALRTLGQPTSYFCLENANWRIVAIDTGYDCTTGLRFAIGEDHTTVHGEVLGWLERVVFADKTDRRPVILLSHHQWFTAFDSHAYPDVGRQLQPYLDRVHLWLWGHEHRFAGYALHAPPGGAPVRARCIGHGGMPVEIGRPHTTVNQGAKPVFLDARHHVDVGTTPVGFCGYAIVGLNGPALTVRYFDECHVLLVEETWTREPDGLRGSAALHVPSIDGNASGYGFKLWRPIEDLVAP